MPISNNIGLLDIQKIITGLSGPAIDRISGSYIVPGDVNPQPPILSLVISDQPSTWAAYKPSPYFGILEVFGYSGSGTAQTRLHTWNLNPNNTLTILTPFNAPLIPVLEWYISVITTGYQDTYISIVDNNAVVGNNIPVGNGLIVFNTDTKQVGIYDGVTNAWVWIGTAQGSNVPIGSILEFRDGIPAPGGYLRCSGQLVDKATYAALYAVIGDWYGSMPLGSTDFRLPNQPNRIIKV